jgi:2-iminobutanoate/2-iminopropanoate deaminase
LLALTVRSQGNTPRSGSASWLIKARFRWKFRRGAGDTLYLSGVAPLKGDLASLELVGDGDMRAQIEWCLEVIKRCLATEGGAFHNWVAQTVYTPIWQSWSRSQTPFGRVFGDSTPTSTVVEVKALLHPQQMVEIAGVAVLE